MILKWGSLGNRAGQFWFPHGVAVDSSGNVFVVDFVNRRIQKFDNNGNFLTKCGSLGSGDGQFDSPTGVAVDSSGNVFVADGNNNRIQKLASIVPAEICNNGIDDDVDGLVDCNDPDCAGQTCLGDGDPCTTDSCVNGQCVYQPINCDDGNPCTIDSCVNGQCVHQPINCDDGDPCTIDSCVNGQCVHQPINCDDGNPCTIDSCVNGQCVHQPINCDDGDPCTIDSCVNGQCVHIPNLVDNDGDGCLAPPCGNDCDDNDPAIGCRQEVCNDGKDNDCDGQVDEGCGNLRLCSSLRSLGFSVRQGQRACRTLNIWNCDKRQPRGTLQWQVSEPCTWLTLQPVSGDSTGERDRVNVCVDTTGLSPGTYRCIISATSNGGNKEIQVRLSVRR